MKKMLILLLLSPSLYAMESDDPNASLTEYQKRKLAIMDQQLKLQKRVADFNELTLIAKHLYGLLAFEDKNYELLARMFFEVKISDLFSEHLENLSEDQKKRMKKLIHVYKEDLAKQRGVDIAHVFDQQVQKEADFQMYARIIEESRDAAQRILKERDQSGCKYSEHADG